MKQFTSQVCTDIQQSQRLLEMGLKPETADMVLIKELAYDAVAHCTYDADTYMIRTIDYLEGEKHRGHIPTWSLHRLIEMLDIYMEYSPYTGINNIGSGSLYDDLINLVEDRIIKKLFNKEYLK